MVAPPYLPTLIDFMAMLIINLIVCSHSTNWCPRVWLLGDLATSTHPWVCDLYIIS